jgi:hypothetical protein
LLHYVTNFSVFTLVQPETRIVRACLDLKVVATIAESNHLLVAVGARVIDYVLAILPLTFDHIVTRGVVFKRFQHSCRKPQTAT